MKNAAFNRMNILAVALFGAMAATQMPMAAAAQPVPANPGVSYAAPSPFGPLKHVQAGLLDVAYAETGPAQGPVVILLHGWPYDIHSYDEVAPLLAAKGYRVLMPYARGYGDTHFLSDQTLRNGQPAALASDVIDFMDALNIQQAVLGGYDWGARSADIVSALWPERVKALVSVSGYLIGNQAAGRIHCRPRPNCNGGISSTSPLNVAVTATGKTPRLRQTDLAARLAEVGVR